MPSQSSSAQEQLRGLADQLRDLRVDAGLSAIDLAAALGWHRTKVSRYEHAARRPSPQDVRDWCEACGAGEQADDLVETLRAVEGAYVEWKRLQRTGLKRLQDSYTELYEQASQVRIYSPVVVPGLFQTPGYIGALLGAVHDRWRSRNDVAEAVEARMARRRVLNDGGRGFAIILEEAVLTYSIGGREVMDEQLRHLLTVMSLPTVSLGIIPAETDRRQWAVETFTLFDTEMVDVELVSARITVTTPSEVKLYAATWDDLRALAVHGKAARRIINAHL